MTIDIVHGGRVLRAPSVIFRENTLDCVICGVRLLRSLKSPEMFRMYGWYSDSIVLLLLANHFICNSKTYPRMLIKHAPKRIVQHQLLISNKGQ